MRAAAQLLACALAAASASRDVARQPPVTAMILDSNGDELLVQTLEHFVLMLPRDVPVVWATDHQLTNAEHDAISASKLLVHALGVRKLHIRTLPYNLTLAAYNMRLRQPRFWADLPQDGRVLLFERDAVLCPGASSRLRNFTRYDYIGAPWRPTAPWCSSRRLSAEACCCNSGLSLSSPPEMARLLRVAAELSRHRSRLSNPRNIDMTVLHYASKVSGFKIAGASSAQRFAVETLWDGVAPPVGLHKPWSGWGSKPWSSTKLELRNLLRVCPTMLRLCPYARAASSNPDPSRGPPARRFVHSFCDVDDNTATPRSAPLVEVPLSKLTPLGYAPLGGG
ncbi:hypothetical protein KFE25_000779 [Diacronema lutheri]|uniref:DUF5672 domain-containing protein n=2 Tax=Diacronema lutheri TaxID=2081491 RepID=A0A8J5XHK9_DIALT|nr:hypothetical protein KFE25_000779 [Diacronema lutheri]